MKNPKIVLESNGVRYQNVFEQVSIYLSMENIANTFEFTTTQFFPDAVAEWGIRMGDFYIVSADDEILSKGYIDEISEDHSGGNRSITFAGRDKTADLVDCHFVSDEDTGTFAELSILQIVTKLCKPFLIEVVADKSVSGAANKRPATPSKFSIEEGVPVIDLIMKLCYKNAILPLTIGDGKLTLTKASTTNMSQDFLSDENIIAKSVELSDRERFKDYECKGQASGNDFMSTTASYNHPAGEFRDNLIRRHRPYRIQMEGDATELDCKNRCICEANQRAGNSRSASVSLQGWTQLQNNKIWRPNTLVPFQSALLGPQETMMISEVQLSASGTSFTTELSLVHKDTYSAKDAAGSIGSEFDDATRLGGKQPATSEVST